MRNVIRRKYNGYRDIRKQFKSDIYNLAKNNKAFVMLIIETYSAMKHRKHIHKMWAMMRKYHAFRIAYNRELMGQMLTGKDEIYNCLGYIEPELYKKYRMKLPECFAMGDSLAIAYRVIREARKNKTIEEVIEL
jgi:hypothetical protein